MKRLIIALIFFGVLSLPVQSTWCALVDQARLFRCLNRINCRRVYETTDYVCDAGDGPHRAIKDHRELRICRITLHIKQGTFLYALSTLNVDNGIPIGFEVAVGHKPKYHLNIDLNNAPLEDVLNKIVWGVTKQVAMRAGTFR